MRAVRSRPWHVSGRLHGWAAPDTEDAPPVPAEVPAMVQAEARITHLADTQPDMPIGVAFVDREDKPGWIGDDPSPSVHHPSVCGCCPTIMPMSDA